MNNQMRKSVLLLAALLVWAALANASMIPALVSEGAVGSNFTFNYSLYVTDEEQLNPAQSDSVTCPGAGNTLVLCNPAGTFFTIYDIPDFVSASVSAAGWSESTQLVGVTPSTINGSSIDSPSAPNVTFTYTGPVVSGPATIAGFQIVVSTPLVNDDGHFTGQGTNNVGLDAGTTDQLSGSVPVPSASASTGGGSVPEPDSKVLMGMGLILAAAAIRRRRART
jgi:MYXO-CTERM domain-containing protein